MRRNMQSILSQPADKPGVRYPRMARDSTHVVYFFHCDYIHKLFLNFNHPLLMLDDIYRMSKMKRFLTLVSFSKLCRNRKASRYC
jgi:hypothetical protein